MLRALLLTLAWAVVGSSVRWWPSTAPRTANGEDEPTHGAALALDRGREQQSTGQRSAAPRVRLLLRRARELRPPAVLMASRRPQAERELGLGAEAQLTEEEQAAEAAPAAEEEAPERVPRRRRRMARVKMEGLMEDVVPDVQRSRKKRILMLISDTGGGHRASAQAMESMLEQVAPGSTDVRIVDVWTDYCPWPFNGFVPSYQFMAKHPWMWKLSWWSSATFPMRQILEVGSRIGCTRQFRRCIDDHEPDLVVSIHPLTQQIPLQVLAQKGGGRRKVPFVTVCTDLGSAHPWWFNPKADMAFVPSDAVRTVARQRGLRKEQIRQYGLPVRPSFWQTPRKRSQLVNELGLESDRKTILVVGGGDGVGSLGKIVEATAEELGRECPGGAQVVAVCGKNRKLRSRLESIQFNNVNVQVCGFVKQMSDYMEVADVIVTKAGPGTIAEATIRGLPTMLSSYLPGQEAGNVPFVVESGFGEYSKDPRQIARTVTGWVQDPQKLAELSSAARDAGAPTATQEICVDLLTMLDEAA